MMRKALLILAITFCFLEKPFAAHIKGGFFTYEYLGVGINDPLAARYKVTLTVYMICTATSAQISNPINFSIFNSANNQFIRDQSVSITRQYDLQKTQDELCISGDQRECYYKVVVYELASLELLPTAAGYTIAYQRCCRINGIQNITNSGAEGNTFMIKIPGTNSGPDAITNSSPAFLVNDTAVVCSGSSFQLNFLATDPDTGDSLSYSFCNALTGATQDIPAPPTASNPPYSPVQYNFPYSGSEPMGAGVTINARTGVISGIAPNAQGEYVLSVCVHEYKEGVFMGTTRKELHVKVGDCSPIAANLAPEYITCDGFSYSFMNGGDQSLITSYFWTFGDPASGTLDSSNLANPTHVFSDTGVYIVTLIVNRGDPCSDTGTTRMKVYPGFFPDFSSAGICIGKPVQFNDATTLNYGVPNGWRWNFGDVTTLADTSNLQNPTWTYPDIGEKLITLIASSSKGCTDTISKTITIINEPLLTLPFKDTLICVPDAVTLVAAGTGSFSWTPTTNMVNANTATPTVSPTTSTTYTVQLTEQGCATTDTVRVNVVNFVTLNAITDASPICLTDPVQLHAVSDGLQYTWTPAATLNDPTSKDPIAIPTAPSTTYTVLARIGSCTATDNVTVLGVPYPVANAGPDDTVCYNFPVVLNGSHNGSSFTWTPISTLTNANTLTPTAHLPGAGTFAYVLSSTDNLGCPKPDRDTVLITVMPKIIPFAGTDTMVIVNQPLQFNATGGVAYQWSPSTALSNPNIGNPVGIYGANMDSIRYRVLVYDAIGCVDSAFVKVTVFKTPPYVFVPSGFTPNGDGLNDVVRPIAVGIKQIKYFSIYNRWGQLLFKTTTNGHGWDGRIKGELQSTNVFVWMVSAVDYLDKPIFLKGTVTLIR